MEEDHALESGYTHVLLRKEFIALAQSDGVERVVSSHGNRRKTGYKWLRRYVHLHARTPVRNRSRELVALRQAHRGAHVLARMLQDRGCAGVPAKSTRHSQTTWAHR